MGKIRICPRCKEPKLRNATNVSGWLAPNLFECSNCQYTGAFFLEVDPEDYEQFKKRKAEEKDEE